MAYGARFDPEKTKLQAAMGIPVTQSALAGPALQRTPQMHSPMGGGFGVAGLQQAPLSRSTMGFRTPQAAEVIPQPMVQTAPAVTQPATQPAATGVRQTDLAPAAMPIAEATSPATGGFTGVHTARDETGYVVPSTFKTAEEAKGFRQFRDELTRSDRPSVAKVLQRDPVTGEYWTQEFMQGTDLSPQYADLAKTQKDFAQARLFGAQAEAQPTETSSAAGLRGAQAQEAQARTKAIQENKNLLKFSREVPAGAAGLSPVKQDFFYDPAKNRIIDPMGGSAPPSRSAAAAAYSSLDNKKKSVVDKYFSDKYPDSEPPPDEFMSYIASLK